MAASTDARRDTCVRQPARRACQDIEPPSATLPAWIETGALAILGRRRRARIARTTSSALTRSTSCRSPRCSRRTASARPNAMEIVRAAANRFDLGHAGRQHDAAARAPERRDAAPGASPLFMSQSVSVLTFLHDRDPGIVPQARGRAHTRRVDSRRPRVQHDSAARRRGTRRRVA